MWNDFKWEEKRHRMRRDCYQNPFVCELSPRTHGPVCGLFNHPAMGNDGDKLSRYNVSRYNVKSLAPCQFLVLLRIQHQPVSGAMKQRKNDERIFVSISRKSFTNEDVLITKLD